MSQKDEKKDALKRESEDKISTRAKERSVANHIAYWIVGVIAVLAIIIGIIGFNYVNSSLQPYNSNSNEKVSIKIPMRSSSKEIAKTLEQDKIIKSATVFNWYIKSHNFTDFQSGYYTFKQSMDLGTVVNTLEKGPSPVPYSSNKVLIIEGKTIDEIGTAIQKSTDFKKSDFLKLMKNESYIKSLAKKYPQLLSSSMASKNVRYHLEGYLYPATYNTYKGMTLKDLVDMMVSTENQYMTPYYETIKQKGLTVHEVLTLASLVEQEGITTKDREMIAGVFFNRIDVGMPLQSDISVMYAMNKHMRSLSIKDTKFKSPYNNYIHLGYGPGPFNSPSLNSIQAVLNPRDRSENYLYFYANLNTHKIKYSKTYAEHQSGYDSMSSSDK